MDERPRNQVRYSYGYGSTPSFQAAELNEQLYSHQLDRLQQANTGNDGFSSYDDFKPPNRQSSQSVPTMGTRPSSKRISSTLMGELDDSTPLSTLMGQVEAKEAQDKEKEFDPEAPTISKSDWLPGESRKEHYHKRELRKARAATAVGRARNAWSDMWSNHWKKLVLGFFAIAACLAILLAFTIPRVPTYSFSSDAPLTSTDQNPYVSSADPTEFYWTSNLSLAINAHSSYVPLKFTEFHVSVRDYQTGVEIGTGNKTMTVDGRKTTDVTIPVYFYGSFTDNTDQTYLDMRESCVHLWTGTTRPTMNLTMTVTSKILGRIGTQTSKRLVATDLTCPIQFASNAA